MNADPARRPVIGITSDVRLEKRPMYFLFGEYSRAVEAAGGLPLQIPPLADPALVPDVLDAIDGVVIVGGEDIDPRLYGEEPLPTHEPIPSERLAFDLPFAKALLASSMPALGVCYGCQLLAVASGGSLVQDIPTQIPGALEHGGRYPSLPMHPITITKGTRVASLLGGPTIQVNSAHHQAPKKLGGRLVATGVAPDGVIEAFEAMGSRFLVGVEWHPELLLDRPEQRRLFEALVENAAAAAARD